MNRDCVVEPPCVAAGQHHYDRHAQRTGELKHLAVPFPKATLRQREASQLVVFLRVGSSEVHKKIGIRCRYRGQSDLQVCEVLAVTNPVG